MKVFEDRYVLPLLSRLRDLSDCRLLIVRLTVINGERRSDEFVGYLEKTAIVMRGIVQTTT